MTIQTSNEHQRAFSDAEMDERVEWDENQQADLDDDLEAYLVETYGPITYADTDRDEDICGEVMSDGEVCERPADECPYHRDDEDGAPSVEERAAEAAGDLDDGGDKDEGGDG